MPPSQSLTGQRSAQPPAAAPHFKAVLAPLPVGGWAGAGWASKLLFDNARMGGWSTDSLDSIVAPNLLLDTYGSVPLSARMRASKRHARTHVSPAVARHITTRHCTFNLGRL
ncbi:uncharacterized protein K452DRAFT_285743 [Aplosporella prunicola CBS 121167]|uniref:Uncharacterized protein n=1 Tax=Aplosporella prunicola CBS 121167 TaxID=1176127 RepID=A0A6A6BLG6_9PEZI|nr:uncharacterized protein K452DRAFT_285743 [Aplosporella prunicola CBS 121167]KAF2143707.1 hypothetical protein K452DRAFT_285743 [Aplosporella prunicola CBS 121167]